MRLLAYPVFAGAVLFSLGEMGFLTEAADMFISFCLALVFIGMHVDWRFRGLKARNLIAGIALVGLAAAIARGSDIYRLLAFALIPAGLCAVMPEDDPRRKDVAILTPAVAFFILAYLAIRYVPHAWWLADHVSGALAGGAGRAIGQQYVFSATQSGFRVMLLVACWGLARFIWAGRRRAVDFGLFIIMLFAFAAAVQMLLTALAVGIQLYYGNLVFLLFNPQVLYLVAALGPIAWYVRRTGPVQAGAAPVRPALLPVALAAGLLIGLGLTLTPIPTGTGGEGRVLIVDEGLLNWNMPVFGRYGERSGGMFGRLPGFLKSQGYGGERVTRPITAETLSGSKALVVINLMKFFSEEEKRVIWDFVSRGGALLILGDHTGVGGIREPFNDLLRPVNIEFEFDSATFWAQGWRDALELMPHPVNRGIIDSEDIQIWIGASLVIRPPARPVIVGRYGYSDIGNAANVERSYLGDRRHNPGEKIGDLVLVTEARYGKGRVMAFGDTSTFQNGALVSSWAFAQRVFGWLTATPRYFPLWLRAALIAAGMALMALVSRRRRVPVFMYAALALGALVAAQFTGHISRLPELPRMDLNKALVDFSHGERFDQLTWYEDCIGGFEFNLMRNGYSAHLMRDFSEDLVLDSEVLVVIAPSMAFSRGEMETIDEYMEAGGLFILSTGFEEKDRSEPLLARLGVAIENVPLAHFEVEVFGQNVRFPEAWPLEVSDPGAMALAAHPDYARPVMVFIPRGEGGALVIGDSQFLLNANIEMLKEWREGNILFLRELFQRYRAGEFKI
ncbi:MAG: hypothetical protein PVF95_13335 [bacterium]|jgi:hypothetical protein